MVKQRSIAILALCASFFAACVIGLGAFTRLIDAGLGCPDWPGCYGQIAVPFIEQADSSFVAYKAWAEMIHRYFAGTLSLLILAIVAMVLYHCRKHFCQQKVNVILAIGIILAVVYQIILGQLTVTLKLLPVIVTQHLIGGFAILSILWLMYLNNKPVIMISKDLQINHSKKYLFFSIIGFAVVLLQIILGAWTSTNYASLSCPDFPFCVNQQPIMTMHFKEAFNLFSPIGVNYEGGVLPQLIRQTIQMTHRLGALMVTLYLIIFTYFAVKKFKGSMDLIKSIYVIWGFLLIQLCIGMANIIFKLPLINAISHTLVAVLLLQAMLTLVYKLAIYPHRMT